MSPYPPPDEIDTQAEQRAFYRAVEDDEADRAVRRLDELADEGRP